MLYLVVPRMTLVLNLRFWVMWLVWMLILTSSCGSVFVVTSSTVRLTLLSLVTMMMLARRILVRLRVRTL